MAAWGFAAALCLAVGGIGGCGAERTETGYVPRRLGSMNEDQRRGLYADPYSPEAKAAAEAREASQKPGSHHGFFDTP